MGNWWKKILLEDQTDPTVILPFNQIRATTTLAVLAVIDAYTVTVASAVGMLVGDIIILFSIPDNRYYQGKILGLAGEIISLDSPIDFEFPIGATVEFGTNEMSVDGSVTPQIFGVRGLATPAGIPTIFHITRIIITCKTATAVSLAKFGDLTALTRGLQMRIHNGTHQNNVFNAKTTGELSNISYDLSIFQAAGPQGQDGFSTRLTFAGQEKLGVALRIPLGMDIEFLVQDNLTGITSLKIMAEGHITSN